ncbi:MAG: arginine--tRNA ligase [Halobacteriovoraceae bacterium]|nr:arginine--tRNA ligase [Halobacteriovoraceae bacterium]
MENSQNNTIRLYLAQIIKSALDEEAPLDEIRRQIALPPQFSMGHFAFACFFLAKKNKTQPNQIANSLAEKIGQTKDPFVAKAQALGPYLNFTLTASCYEEKLLIPILQGSFFKKQISSSQTIMIEYSQPNTHKELHVGHMRNLSLGNTLVRIQSYLGNKIISATYPGDMGTHVAKCLWYLKNFENKPPSQTNKGTWLGKIYGQAVRKLDEEKDSEKKKKWQRELGDILKELDKKKGELFELWRKTRQWSLELMEEIYRWANVSFDKWYFESEVDADSLKRARELYKKGVLKKSQGAIGMDLSEDNLGFCILIKSDGTGMYSTKDIELAFKKFSEYPLDKSIYLVDKRQSLHFQQIFAVLRRMGFSQVENCKHIAHDFVELPQGVMSSRKGNIIPITDLISRMERKIVADYLQRYRDSWSEDEIKKTASMIAIGAIKYGMLRMDHDRKIVFEMEQWLKLDGETGPYLQYVHARIRSLLHKLKYDEKNPVNPKFFNSPREWELMVKLSSFNDVVLLCGKQWKAYTLCVYLYELGKLFNVFYNECPIGKAENDAIRNNRLILAKATGLVIKKGLNLLGIDAPEKM